VHQNRKEGKFCRWRSNGRGRILEWQQRKSAGRPTVTKTPENQLKTARGLRVATFTLAAGSEPALDVRREDPKAKSKKRGISGSKEKGKADSLQGREGKRGRIMKQEPQKKKRGLYDYLHSGGRCLLKRAKIGVRGIREGLEGGDFSMS